MSRHNRQGVGNSDSFVCTRCKAEDCPNCVDVLRSVYTDNLICKCRRKNHMGDAVDEQIVDPFDGSVHGPGAVISQEGEVEFSEEFKHWWRQQFG